MHSLNKHIARDGFRLRGIAMSRVDGFSDVVFGFALTLIVVSLEVPHTYEELHKVLVGFIPFAICFVFLIVVWWEHYTFFRRFGLHDVGTILINAALLFTILFYVYPLKFLFTLIASQFTGHVGPEVFTSANQPRELMIVYGAGYAATYLFISLLYLNAWRQRTLLGLSPLETTLSLTYFWDEIGQVSVGLICCIAAALLPPDEAGRAGYFFFLIGVWKSVHGAIARRRVKRAHTRCTPEDYLPLAPH